MATVSKSASLKVKAIRNFQTTQSAIRDLDSPIDKVARIINKPVLETLERVFSL